jgi:hypothetical protein
LCNHDYRRALDAALFFRSIGMVPLPSRMDEKRPMIEFKDYQTCDVPNAFYTEQGWQTTNIQIMTGVKTTGATKICVVDLDGPEARDAWKYITGKANWSLKTGRHYPWVSFTGSGGLHFWFTLPDGTPGCPNRLLWGLYDTARGWVKHREIRLLGDGGLVVAPPSCRVDGVGIYAWHGKFNPRTIPLPEVAPAWLLEMPGAIAPERKHHSQPGTDYKKKSHGTDLRSVVIDALQPAQKVELARQWGLRFAESFPRVTKGWMPCHAVDRDDKTPSAGFDASTGVYHEFGGEGRSLSLFDLSVALGVFPNWREAVDSVAKHALNS